MPYKINRFVFIEKINKSGSIENREVKKKNRKKIKNWHGPCDAYKQIKFKGGMADERYEFKSGIHSYQRCSLWR